MPKCSMPPVENGHLFGRSGSQCGAHDYGPCGREFSRSASGASHRPCVPQEAAAGAPIAFVEERGPGSNLEPGKAVVKYRGVETERKERLQWTMILAGEEEKFGKNLGKYMQKGYLKAVATCGQHHEGAYMNGHVCLRTGEQKRSPSHEIINQVPRHNRTGSHGMGNPRSFQQVHLSSQPR